MNYKRIIYNNTDLLSSNYLAQICPQITRKDLILFNILESSGLAFPLLKTFFNAIQQASYLTRWLFGESSSILFFSFGCLPFGKLRINPRATRPASRRFFKSSLVRILWM